MVSDEMIKKYHNKAITDKKSVIIVVQGGVVNDVLNLPKEFTYTLVDHDNLKEMSDEEYRERFEKL